MTVLGDPPKTTNSSIDAVQVLYVQRLATSVSEERARRTLEITDGTTKREVLTIRTAKSLEIAARGKD
jgi:hypothetical protein